MSALLDALDTQAASLTGRVLDRMYANPFWRERFGTRGRKHAEQDGRYHVDYLVEALRADDPSILENYARWLQSVLVCRGLCTRHLADNLRLLGEAIDEARVPDAARAVRFLARAEAALLYPEGAARALQVASPAIAGRVAAAVYATHSAWRARWGDAGQQRCADDVSYHLSYLADAVATRRADLFTAYLDWIAAFLERRAVPREHLITCLQALLVEVNGTDGCGEAVPVLRGARDQVARKDLVP